MQLGVDFTANSSNGRRWVSMGRGYFPARYYTYQIFEVIETLDYCLLQCLERVQKYVLLCFF
jgi:hypothetical protein